MDYERCVISGIFALLIHVRMIVINDATVTFKHTNRMQSRDFAGSFLSFREIVITVVVGCVMYLLITNEVCHNDCDVPCGYSGHNWCHS